MARFLPSSLTARRIARALLCLGLLGACSSDSKSNDQSGARNSSIAAPMNSGSDGHAASGTSAPGTPVGNTSGGSFSNSDSMMASSAGSSGMGGTATTPTGASDPASAGDSSDEKGGASDAGVDPEIQNAKAAGQLTAGEWNDLEHWDFWLDLHGDCGNDQDCPETLAAQAATVWRLDLARRIPVSVTSGDAPVVDAEVTLRDKNQEVVWQARTDHAGHAQLFVDFDPLAAHSSPGPYRVEVKAGADSASKDDVAIDAAHPVELSLAHANTPAHSLDLMFVVDTTGSMGDELQYLQSELDDVIKKVRDNVGQQLALRTSVNFYRDQGDEYVVRPFAFTDKVADSLTELSEQRADGGGDLPEAADEGLDDAIANHDWSAHASARLLFLVLDAPPHNQADNVERVQKATRAAAAAGVQLIPVVASGADKPTEFLMRTLAIATDGTYTFLTDDSGIGNSHLKPTIGKFDVELLNALMVRVISERL